MANTGLTVSVEGDNVLFTMSHETFKEWLSSTLEAPRTTSKNISFGFILRRDDVFGLINRILQRVDTQNDLRSKSILISVFFESNLRQDLNDQQFKEAHFPPNEEVNKLSVSLSMLLGITRPTEGFQTRTYEQQRIHIDFTADDIARRWRRGGVNIRVESTDIHWPNEIVSLIEDEVHNLPPAFEPVPKWLLSIFPFRKLPDSSNIGSFASGLALLTVFALVFFASFEPDLNYVFSANGEKLVPLTEEARDQFDSLIEIGRQAHFAQAIKDAEFVPFAEGFSPEELAEDRAKAVSAMIWTALPFGASVFFVVISYLILNLFVSARRMVQDACIIDVAGRAHQRKLKYNIDAENIVISTIIAFCIGAITFFASLALM